MAESGIIRGIEQEKLCRIQWDDCPRHKIPNKFPRFPHVLSPFILPNLNVGLIMAGGTIISANAAYTVRLATNTSITTSGKYAGTRGTSISATQHPNDVILYYKCKNAVTITSCSNFDGVEISYTSVYSGDGSDPNPYQLVNCSFTGNCACHYLKSYSSNGCSACNGSTSGRFMAVSSTQLYAGTHAYHREATCRYCPDGEYFEMGYCNTCPDGGTSVSPTSTEQKTACYLPSGTSFSNTTGKGTHTGNCKWEN